MKRMKSILVWSLLGALLPLTGCAARVGYYRSTGRAEGYRVNSGRGSVWINGYWSGGGHRRVWVPGHWERR